VSASAIGCADRRMAPVMAHVLAERGDTALVFRGDDGLDELTTTTTSSVWVAAGGSVSETSLDPRTFGFDAVPAEALRGGDREHNAAVVRALLAGEAGPVREAVLLNAAAAIAAFDGENTLRTDSLQAHISAGLQAAEQSIDSGAAADLLARWVVLSTRLKG